MIKTLFTLIAFALLISCGGDVKNKFVGGWYVPPENSYYPDLIPEMLITPYKDRMKIEYGKKISAIGNFENNTLTFSIDDKIRTHKIQLNYDKDNDKIFFNAENEIIELERFDVGNLDGAIGLWTSSNEQYGITDSVKIVKEDNFYKIDLSLFTYAYIRGRKSAPKIKEELRCILKNGICFYNTESIDNILPIRVIGDTLFFDWTNSISRKYLRTK